MSVTNFPPNTIHLGGEGVEVNNLAAYDAITPGMLLERYNDSGTTKFRKSTRTGLANSIVALEASMLNNGVDTAYAAGDLVQALVGAPGTTVWGLVASGHSVAAGDALSDAGNGYFKAASGVTIGFAVEVCDNSAGVTPKRIKVEFA